MRKVKIAGLALVSALALPPTIIPTTIPTYKNMATVEAAVTKINATSLKLYVSHTYQLRISGTSKTIKWTSSKSSIASVSSTGKVTAKKTGTSTITATVSGKKYTCKITVSNYYKDGVYTGSGTGFHNGTTKVSVTVKNDRVTNIKVLSNQDTPRFFNSTSSKIISKIINDQSTDVDAVSGATYSSMGIMDAVQNALNKAKN